MKSTIRITLSHAQSTRHVCSISRYQIWTAYMPFSGDYHRVTRALDIWLNSLLENAKEHADGKAGCAAGSHHLRLSASVFTDLEEVPEVLILEHVSCSAIQYLARNLIRVEKEVYRRLLRDGQYETIWDIIPFSYRQVREIPEGFQPEEFE